MALQASLGIGAYRCYAFLEYAAKCRFEARMFLHFRSSGHRTKQGRLDQF